MALFGSVTVHTLHQFKAECADSFSYNTDGHTNLHTSLHLQNMLRACTSWNLLDIEWLRDETVCTLRAASAPPHSQPARWAFLLLMDLDLFLHLILWALTTNQTLQSGPSWLWLTWYETMKKMPSMSRTWSCRVMLTPLEFCGTVAWP